MTEYIHSIGMCRMWRFLAVRRSFFRSSLLYTFPATLLHPLFFHPPSLLFDIYFLVYLSLVVSKFMYNTLLRILFSSILCKCPTNKKNHYSDFNFGIITSDRVWYMQQNSLITKMWQRPCHVVSALLSPVCKMQDMLNKPLSYSPTPHLWIMQQILTNLILTSQLHQYNIYAVTQGSATSNTRWQCGS
jgi:hypothetical protein